MHKCIYLMTTRVIVRSIRVLENLLSDAREHFQRASPVSCIHRSLVWSLLTSGECTEPLVTETRRMVR